jgi:Ran-binding protein 3
MTDSQHQKKRVRESSETVRPSPKTNKTKSQSPPHKRKNEQSSTSPHSTVEESIQESFEEEEGVEGGSVHVHGDEIEELIEYESDESDGYTATPKDKRASPPAQDPSASPKSTPEKSIPEQTTKTPEKTLEKIPEKTVEKTPEKTQDKPGQPSEVNKASVWTNDPSTTAQTLSSKYVFGSSNNPFTGFSPLAKSMQTQLNVDKPVAFGKDSFGNDSFGKETGKEERFGSSFSGGFAATARGGSTFGDLLKSQKKESESEGEVEEEEAQEDEKVHLEPLETFTGEEDEVTLFQVRGKLYHMDSKKEWKERGVGLLRINQKHENHARLGNLHFPQERLTLVVMRADGVLRLILNVNIFEKMPCEVVQGKFLRFVGSESPGQLTSFLVKVTSFLF